MHTKHWAFAAMTILAACCSLSLSALDENLPVHMDKSLPSVTKPDDATTKLEGKTTPYCIWVDTSKWTVLDRALNPIAEYSLQYEGKDVYGMVIPERVEVRLEAIPEIILNVAKTQGIENPKIVKQEKRLVNGVETLYIQWEGDLMGNKLVYIYNVYSGQDSTIQAVTFTFGDLFDEYQKEMNAFLDGFCLIEKK